MANTRRQPVTVNASEVDSALTDFPVHIPRALLDDEVCDPSGDNNAQSNGGDLRWYSDAGATRQPLEVVAFGHDTTTGAGDADVELHGLAPSLSAVVSTTLYLEYNSPPILSQPAASDTYGSENVWDSNYKLVLHMEEDPSGTAPQMLDSTSNGYDATSRGSMTSGDLVDAAVGKGLDFDGTDDDLRVTAAGTNVGSIAGNDEFTFEGVANFDALGDFASLMFLGDPSAALQAAALVVRSSGAFGLSFAGSNNGHTASSAVTTATDYHLAATKAAGAINTTTTLYRNGSSVALSGASTGTPNIDEAGGLGTFVGTGFLAVDGVISEVRISDSVRSAAWIAATDSTLLTPGTFASAGTPVSTSVDTAIQPARHAHTAAAPALTQQATPALQATQHRHTAGTVAVTQDQQAATAGATHRHASESPAVTQSVTLAVQGARHGHTAADPAVSQVHAVAVQGAAHGHQAGDVSLTQSQSAAIESTQHAHRAADVALTQAQAAVVQGADHRHQAAAVALTQSQATAIQGTQHAHQAGGPAVTESTPVAVRSTRHRHTSGSPSLIQQHAPAVSSTRHRHLAAVAALIQQHAVVIPGTRHPHRASDPALTIPAALAAHFARGYTVAYMGADIAVEGRQTAFARTTPRHLATVETEP